MVLFNFGTKLLLFLQIRKGMGKFYSKIISSNLYQSPKMYTRLWKRYVSHTTKEISPYERILTPYGFIFNLMYKGRMLAIGCPVLADFPASNRPSVPDNCPVLGASSPSIYPSVPLAIPLPLRYLCARGKRKNSAPFS